MLNFPLAENHSCLPASSSSGQDARAPVVRALNPESSPDSPILGRRFVPAVSRPELLQEMSSPRTHIKARAKLNRVFCLFLMIPTLATAGDQWAWMVEPSFMDYKVQRTITGSKRTILALVRLRDGEISGVEGGRTLAMAMKAIDPDAQRTAHNVLASLETRFVRDKNHVIQYAILESSNPLTASAVLAPEFADRFASTLGPDILVALPNRFQILVFSRQDQAFRKMGEAIIAGYLASSYPVSREIFSLDNGKLRSLGELK